jgi:transcriptional regulator with XRE-family HTH domain
MTTLQERLRSFIESRRLTVQQFEKRCGMSNGYVKNLKDNMGVKKLECVLTEFPELNKDWLLYGKGGMISSPQNLTGTEYAPLGIPVYDIDATCGADNRTIDFAEDTIVGRVSLPYLNRDCKIIRANGDSMSPTIHDGNWVAVREIQSWGDIFYGQIYLVIMEDYRMLKRLRKYDSDDGKKLILRSDNPDYDDMVVDRKSILRLYIVEDILSVRKLV